MSYTRRKIEEIRSRPCPHDNIDWSYITDWCLDCGRKL